MGPPQHKGGCKYSEEKLRVRVKLTLRILKMSVGMVMVAKLSAQTKTRVTPKITDPIRYNIQPTIPGELAGVMAVVAGEVEEVRTLETMEGRLMLLLLSCMIIRDERVSVAAAAVIVGVLVDARFSVSVVGWLWGPGSELL